MNQNSMRNLVHLKSVLKSVLPLICPVLKVLGISLRGCDVGMLTGNPCLWCLAAILPHRFLVSVMRRKFAVMLRRQETLQGLALSAAILFFFCKCWFRLRLCRARSRKAACAGFQLHCAVSDSESEFHEASSVLGSSSA